jgi:hemoglobin/transferrin/lactoferrin receptor protein
MPETAPLLREVWLILGKAEKTVSNTVHYSLRYSLCDSLLSSFKRTRPSTFHRTFYLDALSQTRATSRLQLTLIACAVASTLLPASLVYAQTPAAPAAPAGVGSTLLKEVTVTSTRTEQDVSDVANTVTVIPAQKLERENASDIKDALRYEPGVSVRNQPSRFQAAGAATGRSGNEGINIRGLEGNQVLLQVDGVRLPNFFTFGAQAAGRGDYIDIEAFKTIEVLRGPASTLYGSDGLAGAVSFITKDPRDLLTLGKPWQATHPLIKVFRSCRRSRRAVR